MPTVIRATDQNRSVLQPAFNFEDMSVQAARYLDGVRAEAARLVLAAQKEAEQIRRRAEEEGRAAGMKKVQEMVQQQMAKELQTLLPALRQAIREIQLAKNAWLSHWEKGAIGLAAAIADRLVRREIQRNPELPLALVREALELAAGSSHLKIHLHPSDLETLRSQVEVLVRELAPLATAELVSDPTVSRGGCRLDTRLGTIDQRIESQLTRIEEELTEK